MSLASNTIAVAVTTYNRATYLQGLLDSLIAMDPAPDFVVVVDNASTDHTPEVIARAAAEAPFPILSERLAANIGGAGGFAAGIERALAEGADWVWVMDDDVRVLPGALSAFQPWMGRYGVLHGRRYDANGEPFFWQHDFNSWTGVPLPVQGDIFRDADIFHTNVACFEGMFVSAGVIAENGLPDPRFFINGDDTMFGWKVSQRQPVALINDFVIQKVRPQKQIDLGIRHLNDSSDLSRYYSMRNRGLVAQYLKAEGKFSRVGFALGTVLTFLKELARLGLVEHKVHGVKALLRGWRDSRALIGQSLDDVQLGVPARESVSR
ncbi:glycosyltransferase [Haematomicrobium sanguinis]|uniref:glycosyltransferase n=1 Tax=Haematomicrobium sanguinis TaxID=479106 RepID=UPI00068A0CCF|nr:glycosyltransferase [Haematomicrobium sanguinis]